LAHYLLLAAIHRICQPGPKTEVSDCYDRTVLLSLWKISPERFTSQAFWDAFERILPEEASGDDSLEDAPLRLLDLWKEKQAISRRLLAYDTTNFYTYIASTNNRNELAQRGHHEQGRHNLRQVGLSYVLDGESGWSLCHHVYPGDVADAGVRQRNRRAGQYRGTEAGMGWISALPWNQAPAE
jgi:transposase